MNNTKVLQAISGLNKEFDSRGDTEAKDILKKITSFYLKKDYINLDQAVFDLQNLKDYSESFFKQIYTVINNIYDNIYNNNKEAIFTYNLEKIKEAEEHFKNPNVDDNIAVTITTTTCKRTDLITRTVDSFLECVLDYKKYVKEWIIIDDNSNDKDRQFMKERYPFIRFIYKTPEQKGHPRSMNMLLKEIKTPYVFNLEDDFEFFRRDNYFKRMINIVNIDKSYGQCLMNVNYSEDTDSANNLWGSSMKKSIHGRYFVHNFYTGKELEEAQRKVGCPSCLYWPHFSFRVGITKTSIFKDLGEYDEKAKHFEMEYAYRYVSKGYKTTFLDGVYCAHIGRRTYERNTDKKNAYDLNEEVQFGEEHRVTKKEETPKDIIDISAYVINLKRRPDRLRNFFTKNQKELFPLTVFEGVDGKNLQPSHKVQKAFSTGDYNYRRGIVGCAMSHMKIWKDFLTKAFRTHCLVLEDDAELCPEFKDKVIYLINKHSNNFDIMFLHYNPYPQYSHKELYTNSNPVAEIWSKEKSMRENMGSGAGYILTRQGAINLLKHVQKYGVYNAIDWVMFKSENRIMYVSPLLVRANCFQSTNGGCDTDIQNVYNSVCFTGNEWDQYEVQYLADKLISSYHNKEKLTFVNLYYKGYDEKDISGLIKDKNKFIISKNLKGLLTIIITKTPDLSQLINYVCILPISELNNVSSLINLQPIKCYNTNNFVYCIPDRYLDNIIEDKVWDNSLLNISCPF